MPAQDRRIAVALTLCHADSRHVADDVAHALHSLLGDEGAGDDAHRLRDVAQRCGRLGRAGHSCRSVAARGLDTDRLLHAGNFENELRSARRHIRQVQPFVALDESIRRKTEGVECRAQAERELSALIGHVRDLGAGSSSAASPSHERPGAGRRSGPELFLVASRRRLSPAPLKRGTPRRPRRSQRRQRRRKADDAYDSSGCADAARSVESRSRTRQARIAVDRSAETSERQGPSRSTPTAGLLSLDLGTRACVLILRRSLKDALE